MSRTYYAVRYLLDGKIRFLIWHTGDEADGVYLGQDGAVSIFKTLAELVRYAQSHDLSQLKLGDQHFHNLDVIKVWLKRKRPGQIHCEAFLNAWNLLGDVSASVGIGSDPDPNRTQNIYQKLFWGSNIPAITPPGKHFTPLWSGAEVTVMREVLGAGLSHFRNHVRLRSVSPPS